MDDQQRAAFLRFAEFESKKIEEKDDTTLLVLHVALTLLAKRDPFRVANVLRACEEIVRGP